MKNIQINFSKMSMSYYVIAIIMFAILTTGSNIPDYNKTDNSNGDICVIAGQWVPSGTFPDVPVGSYYGASVWLDDTLYHQKPSPNGGAANSIIQYTWNGTWILESRDNLPFNRTATAMVAAAGKLYSIGGSSGSITGGPYHTSVISYDPAVGRWTFPVMESMPMALAGHSAVVWGDSVIFVIGGPYTGSGTNLDVHYYRIASNTWGTISNSLPAGEGRRTFGLGIVGNKIIMSGGFNTEFLKSTWVGTIGSDASSITWEAAPDIPLPSNITGLSRCGATTYGDFFFLVNGERGGPGGYHDTTHVFSVSLNQWVGMITDIPFNRSNIFNNVTARCIDDTVSLFIPGGFGSVTGEPPGEGTDRFDVTRIGILTGITATMNLKALIEGFYDPSLNKMVEDTARTYLRNTSLPYSIVDSSKSVLDSSGSGNFNFFNAVNSVPYYVVVKHRNGLETWSAAGNVFISGSLSYDFTIAASQAFGSNMVQIDASPVRFAIYSGDANQDGVIDITDGGLVDNDAFNFLTGYVSTDVNFDEVVDVSDAAIVDNNTFNFVAKITP